MRSVADPGLVDIILPTRNRGAVVLEAVRSVQAQTHRDWRLWIVDDASSDGSDSSLLREAEADQRITVLRRTHRGGPAAARQTGLEAGTAPWVALIDSDDRWRPRRLQAGLDATDDPRTDAVFGAHQWQQGSQLGAPLIPTRQWKRFPFVTNNFSTILVKRPILEAAGGFVPKGQEPLWTCEHLDLCLRLIGRWRVTVVPEPLAICVAHNNDRASDRFGSLQAATELDRTRRANADRLGAYPEVLARLTARSAARYAQVRQYRRALALAMTALAVRPTGSRVQFLRTEAPRIVRVVGDGVVQGARSPRARPSLRSSRNATPG